MRRRIVMIVAAAVALAPGAARGQATTSGRPAPEWFAGASVGAITSPSSEAIPGNPSILTPQIGGTALTGLFTAGVFATRHIGFAAELTLPTPFHVQQTWGRDATTWDNDHRDITLAGLALARVRIGSVDATGVAGAGRVWSRTIIVERVRRLFPPPGEPVPVYTTTRRLDDLALVTGGELSWPMGSHLAGVVDGRVIFVGREDSNDYDARLPTVLTHAGVGLRVRF
jgi:hypothetical protein